MAEVSVKVMDDLLALLKSREEAKDAIEADLKEMNKEISSLQIRATELLKSLDREEYDGPHGKISFETVFNVKQPTDENKHLLWDWMRERGIFERYASVNAISLKSLFKAERNAAIEAGEDPMTFSLPGMEPATIFEKLKFRPKK